MSNDIDVKLSYEARNTANLGGLETRYSHWRQANRKQALPRRLNTFFTRFAIKPV
jgi:hypothetical protein